MTITMTIIISIITMNGSCEIENDINQKAVQHMTLLRETRC